MSHFPQDTHHYWFIYTQTHKSTIHFSPRSPSLLPRASNSHYAEIHPPNIFKRITFPAGQYGSFLERRHQSRYQYGNRSMTQTLINGAPGGGGGWGYCRATWNHQWEGSARGQARTARIDKSISTCGGRSGQTGRIRIQYPPPQLRARSPERHGWAEVRASTRHKTGVSSSIHVLLLLLLTSFGHAPHQSRTSRLRRGATTTSN